MYVEGNMLNEKSQTEKDKDLMISLIQGMWRNQEDEINKK